MRQTQQIHDKFTLCHALCAPPTMYVHGYIPYTERNKGGGNDVPSFDVSLEERILSSDIHRSSSSSYYSSFA